MIFSPGHDFFVNNDADWLSDVERIEKILNSADYQIWQDLRAKPYSRFLGMAMPEILVRSKYENVKVGFIYNESGSGYMAKQYFLFYRR